MMSIQLILAVVVVAAVCGSDSDKYYDTKPDNYGTKPGYYDTKPAYIDTQPECYKKDGYCEHFTCRKGYVCDVNNSYGCPRDAKCCLPDESYTPYQKAYGDHVEYQKPYGDNVDDYYNA